MNPLYTKLHDDLKDYASSANSVDATELIGFADPAQRKELSVKLATIFRDVKNIMEKEPGSKGELAKTLLGSAKAIPVSNEHKTSLVGKFLEALNLQAEGRPDLDGMLVILERGPQSIGGATPSRPQRGQATPFSMAGSGQHTLRATPKPAPQQPGSAQRTNPPQPMNPSSTQGRNPPPKYNPPSPPLPSRENPYVPPLPARDDDDYAPPLPDRDAPEPPPRDDTPPLHGDDASSRPPEPTNQRGAPTVLSKSQPAGIPTRKAGPTPSSQSQAGGIPTRKAGPTQSSQSQAGGIPTLRKAGPTPSSQSQAGGIPTRQRNLKSDETPPPPLPRDVGDGETPLPLPKGKVDSKAPGQYAPDLLQNRRRQAPSRRAEPPRVVQPQVGASQGGATQTPGRLRVTSFLNRKKEYAQPGRAEVANTNFNNVRELAKFLEQLNKKVEVQLDHFVQKLQQDITETTKTIKEIDIEGRVAVDEHVIGVIKKVEEDLNNHLVEINEDTDEALVEKIKVDINAYLKGVPTGMTIQQFLAYAFLYRCYESCLELDKLKWEGNVDGSMSSAEQKESVQIERGLNYYELFHTKTAEIESIIGFRDAGKKVRTLEAYVAAGGHKEDYERSLRKYQGYIENGDTRLALSSQFLGTSASRIDPPKKTPEWLTEALKQ